MSQLKERCDGNKIGTGMITGTVIAAREVWQLSEVYQCSGNCKVIRKM